MKEQKVINKTRCHLILFLCFLMAQSVLFGSISVSPSLFELKIPPGKTFTDSIRVVNVTDLPTDIIVYLSDFGLTEDGDIRFYDAGTTEYSFKNYVRINPTSFTLEPGEEKWVRFSLRMPAGQVGETQGIIFFQTVPRKVKSPAGRRVLVAARIGSTVYAAMKPTINVSADIVNVLVRRTYDADTLEYAVIVHNDGNMHIRPKGKLVLRDSDGKKTTIPDVNEKNSSVLRNSVRLYEGTLKGSFPEGMYRATLELDFGKEKQEVEKVFRLAPATQVPKFVAAYETSTTEGKASRVNVTFQPGAMEASLQNPRSFFRLRTLLGKVMLREPLKQCLKKVNSASKSTTAGYQCVFQKDLDPGVYIAEILLFDGDDAAGRDSKPVSTFQKLEVKE